MVFGGAHREQRHGDVAQRDRLSFEGVAPFGQIVLEASDRLVLGDASLTSVSGAGLGVLYGTLRNAEYWLDPSNPQGRSRTNPNDAGVLDENRYLSSLPEKRVSLQAPDVSMAAGAVVDIAGGGELYAWEHVPGSGGSHDALTLPGMYAVLPRYGGLSPEVAAGGDADGVGVPAARPSRRAAQRRRSTGSASAASCSCICRSTSSQWRTSAKNGNAALNAGSSQRRAIQAW